MSTYTQFREERAELELVLASETFLKCPNLGKLLSYLCNKYFEGCGAELKEYNIGVEAMGRPADFDPTSNSIVRVDAHRLREKLKKYYEREGAGNKYHIQIEPGHYVPRFVPHESVPAAAAIISPTPAGTTEPREFQARHDLREVSPGPPAASGRRTIAFLAGGLGVAVLTVAGLLAWIIHQSAALKASQPPVESHFAVAPAVPGSLESVHILCGYLKERYIDRAGTVWSGDRYFAGGRAISQPPEFLARAPDIGLFQSERSGQFSYDIPLKPGNYEVHLYFSETHYGPGELSGGGETSRLFNVSMNGKPLLKIFDIIKDAGGNNVGDVRVFNNVHPAPDGNLHFKFESLIDSPILNAIEIEPAPPGKINPVRIIAQDNSYTDHLGNIWSPDRYFYGGQLATHLTRAPVRNTDDPGLFAGERFGNFSYAIPVAPGKYRVTLRFAETYWGVAGRTPSLPDQNGSLQGGIGSRVFHVYCNGSTLLRDFDIFKEAGGSLVGIEKTFDNLEPNPEGKLVLNFIPATDYASVTALEVLSEPH